MEILGLWIYQDYFIQGFDPFFKNVIHDEDEEQRTDDQ